jgi:menaquinone-dependent protoporphyrinogen oxidase
MKILVTVASKHGATGEIGEIVAEVLRRAGLQVETRTPEAVPNLDGFDAVILGSGVYAGRWLGPARDLAHRLEADLLTRRVWLFSSGPVGDPPLPEADPAEALALADRLGARDHRSFAGRLDRSQLGFVERTITKAVKAAEGDFRDVEAIRRWADEIAHALTAEEVPA